MRNIYFLLINSKTKSFVSKFLSLGKEQPIQEDDLPNPVSDDESKKLTDELEK